MPGKLELELKLKRFENVTTMIRYHNDKMVEAFNRFLRFTIGIIGGNFWLLSLKDIDTSIRKSAIVTAPWLLCLVAIGSLSIIFFNWKSWYGFRKAEASLSGGKIPAPELPRAFSEQIIMTIIIVLVCSFFIFFNPFSSLPNDTKSSNNAISTDRNCVCENLKSKINCCGD